MPTIRAGDAAVRFRVPVGEALSVTAPLGSSVSVVHYNDLNPSVVVTNGQQLFGPYTGTKTLTITCLAGAGSFESMRESAFRSDANINSSGAVATPDGNVVQLDYSAERVGSNQEQPARMTRGVVLRNCKLAANFAPTGASAVTFNAVLAQGATSGTLAGNWAGATAIYSVTFSNNDVRLVTLTSGATTATWATGLSIGATAAASAATVGWTINGGTPILTHGYTGWDGAGNKVGPTSRTGQTAMLRVDPGSNGAEDLNLGNFSTNMLTKALAGKVGLWVYVENLPGYAAPVPLALTAAPAAAATSATLANAWTGATGAYPVVFYNQDTRTVTLTNGATTATWTGGLASGATATAGVTLGLSPLALTAAPAAAATSATLSANWTGTTGAHNVTFSNGDIRAVTLTNGATTATWSGGLSSIATAVAGVTAPANLAGSIEVTISTNAAGNTNGLLIGFNANQVRQGWNFLKFVMRNPLAYQSGTGVTEYHPGGVNCTGFGTGVDSNILANDAARLKVGWTNMFGARLYFDVMCTDFDTKPQIVLGNDAGAGLIEIALPIFQNNGWVGYTAFPYRIWSAASGSKTIADLNLNQDLGAKQLYAAGWEKTNHTANHLPNGSLMTETEIEFELRTANAWQNALGMPHGAAFYCSPQSSTSALSEKVIAGMGYKIQRNGRRWNNPVTQWGLDNPNNLGSIDMGASAGFGVSVITSGSSSSIAGFQQASKIKRVIDVIVAYGDTLLLFWHGITTTGDNGGGEDLTGDPLLITKSAFEMVAAYIRSYEISGSLKVCRGFTEFYYGS